MDLAILSMDAVRQMDDAALRRVIAELLGWRLERRKREFDGVSWYVVRPDGTSFNLRIQDRETLAWQDFWEMVPDWVDDLSAAVALLPDDWGWQLFHPEKEPHVFSVSVEKGTQWEYEYTMFEQGATNPARAICLAWIALRLAQREAAHD